MRGDDAVRVHLPGPLLSYTDGASVVELEGSVTTVGAALDALERRAPGIRFRVVDERDRLRPTLKLFVGSRPCADLAAPLVPPVELHLVAALSGG